MWNNRVLSLGRSAQRGTFLPFFTRMPSSLFLTLQLVLHVFSLEPSVMSPPVFK